MSELTDKQADVLRFMRRYIDRYQVAPTMQTICDEFGWASVNSAQSHLKGLERKGAVERGPRGYVPTETTT